MAVVMAPAAPLSVWQGRLLLIAAANIWGTYTVMLRMVNAGGNSTPLPAIFVCTARYQFLGMFASLQKKWLASSATGIDKAAGVRSACFAPRAGQTMVAAELAAITFVGSVLSIWGASFLPAATCDILAATDNIFVPVLTVLGSGFATSGFGANTWVGCFVAFAAAIVVALVSAGATGPIAQTSASGEAAVIASAFLFALQRVRGQFYLRRYEAVELNNERMLWMGYISLGMLVLDALCDGPSSETLYGIADISLGQWALIALSSFLSAFVASTLRWKAQSVVPAANAQPLLTLQPLFTSAWAWLLLGEPVQRSIVMAGCLQICGAVLASTDRTVQSVHSGSAFTKVQKQS